MDIANSVKISLLDATEFMNNVSQRVIYPIMKMISHSGLRNLIE